MTDSCKVAKRLFNLETTASNSLAHAGSLNEFVQYLLQSIPYFQWLQRRDDPPAPRFNNFEHQIGWDWQKMLGLFANALNMNANDCHETKDSVISACANFSEFANRIGLNFGRGDTLPELMEYVQHSNNSDAMDICVVPMEDVEMEDVELEDISPNTLPGPLIPLPSADTDMLDTVAPTVGLQERATQPQLDSAGGPDPARSSTQLADHPQSAADGSCKPSLPRLQGIWSKLKAEAKAKEPAVATQASAARGASSSQRRIPTDVAEEEDDDKNPAEGHKDLFQDCKGTQMRKPESLQSFHMLKKAFSVKEFQQGMTYEFSKENVEFELDELHNTGENVSTTFAERIELACEYIICSRRRSIARATQLLQHQMFRDFQVDARRLRKRLESNESTPEFRGDETLTNLIDNLRQVEAIFVEDGEVKWTI